MTPTGKTRITGIKTFLFFHQKYHMDYLGIEPDLCGKKPANDLKHDLQFKLYEKCFGVGLGWTCVAFAEHSWRVILL